MSKTTIPEKEINNRFDNILDELAQSGGSIIVEQAGKPVAVILSMHEYEQWQNQTAPIDDELDLIKSAFGLWSDREDINENWLANGRSRWEST